MIENEFGEIAVDSDLIVDAGDEIFETQNGWYVYISAYAGRFD